MLNARKLFARIKGGKLRTIILAMSSHAVARRRRRLEHRAITKLQAAWRGIHARWHFRRCVGQGSKLGQRAPCGRHVTAAADLRHGHAGIGTK